MNGIADYIATAPYMWQGQEINLWGHSRGFNFDGSRPFRNPDINQGDMGSLQFNSTQINDWQITPAGSGDSHITKVADPDGAQLTRIKLLATDGVTPANTTSYRTQINSYPVLPYKQVVLDLAFRLDPNWNFSMPVGDGLIWQLKGLPKAGQKGNPVSALNLYGNQLDLTVLYPQAALNAATWPASLQWTDKEYAPVTLPRKTVRAGVLHRVKLVMTLDDRPAKFGGTGFITAYFDDQPWTQYVGPTLHPDQAGPHSIGFGWYQWAGKPNADRIISFKTCRLYEWQ